MIVPPGKTTVGIDDAVNEEQYEEEESNSYVGFSVASSTQNVSNELLLKQSKILMT